MNRYEQLKDAYLKCNQRMESHIKVIQDFYIWLLDGFEAWLNVHETTDKGFTYGVWDADAHLFSAIDDIPNALRFEGKGGIGRIAFRIPFEIPRFKCLNIVVDLAVEKKGEIFKVTDRETSKSIDVKMGDNLAAEALYIALFNEIREYFDVRRFNPQESEQRIGFKKKN